ncbi:MAG TPA: hypothetical protein VH092_37925, partial [Urbifossiella sp.]|nr:hypothetical protein [Urbifossiella sp.]
PAPEPAPQPQPAPPPKDDPKTPPKDEPKTPPAPAAVWELDPAKHTVPAAPAAGSLGKAAFAPQAEFQDDTLTFRAFSTDGTTSRVIAVKLPADLAKTAAGGLKLVVKPDEDGAKVPVVLTELPAEKKDALPKLFEYKNGFALTLDLGKREKGSLPGKVFISLPGEEKDFLAGTFTADWVRPPSEPPGADDAPFVQGAVTVAGAKADTDVRVGYVGTPKGMDLTHDSLTMRFALAGLSGRSDHAKPRVTFFAAADAPEKAGRYEHVRLPAGKYLVFASATGAPPVGKWVTLPADGKLTQDFAVDPGKAGKLEVKVPAGATGKVMLVPADDGPVSPEVFGPAASVIGLEADVQNGVARFDRLAPGRYEARLGDAAGTAEVKLNETATLELTPPKK